MKKSEAEIIALIDDVLGNIDDLETLGRIITWTRLKYDKQIHENPLIKPVASQSPDRPAMDSKGSEIPGVACVTSSGVFKFLARDIKAKSTRDAAVRIAHVIILAYEKLTGSTTASSRKILSPVLQEWRAYDGNTRHLLANYKGIVRDGDNLSLDAHARKDAEKFMADITDNSVIGEWQPSGMKKGKSKLIAKS